MSPRRITIGNSNGRKVWLDPTRRSYHLHVIGGTGKGKSKFLEHMIREDIMAGHGVCLVDPHGGVYDSIVSWCALNRVDEFRKVHLLDPQLADWRTGFNPLKRYAHEEPLHRVDSAIEALGHVWGGEKTTDTPSIRTVLRAIFTVLIENGHTLSEAFSLTRLYDDDKLRTYLTSASASPLIREMWEGYEVMSRKAPLEFVREFGGARRRLLELLHDERIREMLGQNDHAIDLRKCMDEGHVVLAKFSNQAFGEARARAVGALLIRELFLVAKDRDLATAERRPFYLYIDECAQFLTNDINSLLAQTRKFGLHATLAHQWLEQLREASPAIFAAVVGIQNKVVFGGLRDEDATLLADELFRTEYDIEMPVAALIKPTIVRYVQTWLHHWAESETTGTVESGGESTSFNVAIPSGATFDENGFPVGGISGTDASSASTGEQSSTSEISANSRASGESEAYLPELENRPTAVHSMENIRHLATRRLRRLPVQNAIVKPADLPSFDLVAYTIDPVIVAPMSRAAFIDRVMTASPYALPVSEAREVLAARKREVAESAEHWREPPPIDEHPDDWRG